MRGTYSSCASAVSAADCICRFFFYIDDCADALSLEDYQRGQLLGRPQSDPVLAHYHEILAKIYDHWDPVCANVMVCAAMEFMNGTILENRAETKELAVMSTAPTWPKYLRAKSGLGPAAACAIFPMKVHPDISAFIQVVPDIDEYTYLANDVLSFVPFSPLVYRRLGFV
jgi:hypothetical protein